MVRLYWWRSPCRKAACSCSRASRRPVGALLGARDFQVIAVDQRGIGLSDKPQDGYDAGTQADDLVALMEALGHQLRHVRHRHRHADRLRRGRRPPRPVERLVVSEAPLPGVTPSPPLFLPPPLNARLWHLAFNQLPAKVNDQLVRGREAIFFGADTMQLVADDVRTWSSPTAATGSPSMRPRSCWPP
jgi:hypothetical protein